MKEIGCYSPQYQYVKLDTGIQLSYVELGEKNGDTIVLIHGATDSYISFSQVASVLVDKGYHVYIPELRGHGNSDKPEGELFTAELLTKDIVEWMDQVSIEKAHIVGHSLGSMIAQNIAIAYPKRVSSLTLIGTAAKFADNPTIAWLLEGDDEFPGLDGLDEIPDDFIIDWTSSTNNDEEFIKSTYEHAKNLPASVWGSVFKGALEADNTSALASVTMPVQIIWGTADVLFSKEDQLTLIDALGSGHIVFKPKPDIGHNVHWEGDLYKTIADDIDSFI